MSGEDNLSFVSPMMGQAERDVLASPKYLAERLSLWVGPMHHSNNWSHT